MTMEMCVQNLAGENTMISFHAEAHGSGFRYEALQWRTKFKKTKWYKSFCQVHVCLLSSSKEVDSQEGCPVVPFARSKQYKYNLLFPLFFVFWLL
ncbi:hypothetical protein Hanom_Chr17g01551921 [Helianthus anomalus]